MNSIYFFLFFCGSASFSNKIFFRSWFFDKFEWHFYFLSELFSILPTPLKFLDFISSDYVRLQPTVSLSGILFGLRLLSYPPSIVLISITNLFCIYFLIFRCFMFLTLYMYLLWFLFVLDNSMLSLSRSGLLAVYSLDFYFIKAF